MKTLICILLGSCAALRVAAAPGAGATPLPCERVGNIEKSGFNEPSGICYHAGRGTLFAVGDNGDIGEFHTDGRVIRTRHVRHADFEGITWDPSSGLLYVAVEGREKILEVDPDRLAVRREFGIPRRHEGRMLLKPGGQGIEAIAFVPDAGHPEGGTFFVSNQGFRLDDREDGSVILELSVPLRSATNTVRVLRHVFPGVIDLAAMHYDKPTDRLLIVSDATDTLTAYTRDLKPVQSWRLPGRDQEGLTLDPDDYMYIAQDSGGILKLKWRREKPAGTALNGSSRLREGPPPP
jgi:hypothetical protein